MNYRVEELAGGAQVSVDTVRFYQSKGLLPAPRRVGRVAAYGADHLERLRRIRSLQRDGFTLAQIQRILKAPAPRKAQPLLNALVQESVGARTLSRAELAAEAGIPEALVKAVESAHLVEPLVVDGEERFSESDLKMARAALSLLSAGFPLQELLGIAVNHATHVRELCDAAIELFDEHVRKNVDHAGDMERITEAFRTLLPQVTRLVALHFQRTLVNRALNRLEGRKEHEALEAALAATESARLDVEVAWR